MKKMYMNTDINTGTFPFLSKLAERDDITPAMLYPYVDVHKLTRTTDFVMNMFGQHSSTPSEVFSDYKDIFNAGFGTNDGNAISKASNWQGLYKVQKQLIEKYNTDIYAVWTKRCREIGYTPWFSFRMNDCHGSAIKKPISEKDFFSKAVRNGWTIGEEYGYYKTCLDYEIDEVREMYLLYTREQMMRYDVDGLELDFLREYHNFKYLSADMDKCRNIMTEFIRSVRRILDECEKVHGHKIKLSMRVPRDVEHCIYYGFDIQKIAREGLVDLIIPAPRFASSDSGMDIDEWRRLVPDVEIIPGIEAAAGVVDGKFVDMSKEMALGVCAGYLSYNPSGLYFFNYFITPHMYSNFYTPLCQYEKDRLNTNEPWMKSYGVLQCATDYDAIFGNAVRFPLIVEWFESCAGYPTMWRPIPADVSEEEKTFTIRTGKIPEGKIPSIILGFTSEASDFSVTVNGKEVEGFKENPIDFIEGIGWQPAAVVPKGTVCYRAPFDYSLLNSPEQTVTIKSKTAVTVNWIEINVY